MLSILSNILNVGVQYGDYYTTYGAATAADAGAATFSLLITCCCIVLGFLINFVIAYLVYKDAVKNNVENPILWAILTFFFTLVGLLVYFLAIRPKTNTVAPAAPVAEKKSEDKN
jgi:hypothetical protein